MSPPDHAIPRKTDSGREEQRSRRSGTLGQRHRTILFLVDGQRTAAEVLRLAEQAGAGAQHYDELLRLGLIEVPGVAPGAAAVADGAAGAAAAAPAGASPSASAPGFALHATAVPDVPGVARATASPQLRAEAAARSPEAFVARSAPLDIPLLDEVAVPRVSGAPLVPVRLPPGMARGPAMPAPQSKEDRGLLDEARAHLLEALRMDPPPFVSRLASRVRGAADAAALTELVLQFEREIGRDRRSPAGLGHIEQARELLGLGNTVVADDSSWHGWPDTL